MTDEIIRGQLARILSSEDFRASARLKDFLSFVVEEALAGRGDQLKAYTIALAVFERGADFDPMLDPIVRVEAGRLRKALERYYFIHQNDPVMIKIPTGSYIPLFERNADAQAGADMGTEKDELETILDKKLCSKDGKIKQERRPVLLLMPFSNLTGDEGLLPLVYGLAEDMARLLARVKTVDVVPVSPAAVSSGQADMLDLARKHNARFILHGHIASMENTFLVYASLTDARDNTRIWTDKYDYPMPPPSLLELQEEVGLKVSFALADSFGAIVRKLMYEFSYLPLEEIGSYEASFFHNIWESALDRSSYLKACSVLECCLGFDPHNALLISELARLYTADFQFAFGCVEGNLDKATDLAKLSIGKEPNSLMGNLALAHNHFVRGRVDALEETLNIIFSLPDLTPYALSTAGVYIGFALDMEKGLELMDQGAKLNPHQPGFHRLLPFIRHYEQGDFSAALKETLLLNIPTSIWDPIAKITIYTKLNQPLAVENAVEHLFMLDPDFKPKQNQILESMLFKDRWIELVAGALKEAGV